MLRDFYILLGVGLVGLGLPEPVALIFYGVSLMAYGCFFVNDRPFGDCSSI
jgi:hypothetical protein